MLSYLFLYWVVWVLYIFWILTPYQVYNLIIFFPFHRLYFHFVTGWDYYLGTVGMNSVCQDPSVIKTPHPTSLSQWLSPEDSLIIWGKIRVGAPTKWPTMLGVGIGCPPWVFFAHWRNRRLKGDLSMWCCTGLGEGQCNQCVTASLTF